MNPTLARKAAALIDARRIVPTTYGYMAAGESGTYHIRFLASTAFGASGQSRYVCDCPAATSGKECHHITAVRFLQQKAAS